MLLLIAHWNTSHVVLELLFWRVKTNARSTGPLNCCQSHCAHTKSNTTGLCHHHLSTFPVIIKLSVQENNWAWTDRNSEVFNRPQTAVHKLKQHRKQITSTRLWEIYWLFTDSRDGGHNLSELQFIQDGCFSSCVQTDWNQTKQQTLNTTQQGSVFNYLQVYTFYTTVSLTFELGKTEPKTAVKLKLTGS